MMELLVQLESHQVREPKKEDDKRRRSMSEPEGFVLEIFESTARRRAEPQSRGLWKKRRRAMQKAAVAATVVAGAAGVLFVVMVPSAMRIPARKSKIDGRSVMGSAVERERPAGIKAGNRGFEAGGRTF